MNKEFWYKNGKVFIRDTKGKVRNVVYSVNLKEILLQENCYYSQPNYLN